jgi:hypothetical protein
MFIEWSRSAAALVRGLLLLLAGTGPTTATSGVIAEVEPGEGPSWGTLSGLTAHPTDPSRIYAVTDADSPPARLLRHRALTSPALSRKPLSTLAASFCVGTIVARFDIWIAFFSATTASL